MAEMWMTYTASVVTAQIVREVNGSADDDPAQRTWLLRKDGWVKVSVVLANLENSVSSMRQALRG